MTEDIESIDKPTIIMILGFLIAFIVILVYHKKELTSVRNDFSHLVVLTDFALIIALIMPMCVLLITGRYCFDVWCLNFMSASLSNL